MATIDAPTAAQSLLALYGALDQAVTATGDAAIEATVERYLPGTTGANAGWYTELLGFLSSPTPSIGEAPGVPDLSQALTVLQVRNEPVPAPKRGRAAAVQTAGMAEAEDQALTTVQMSRMVYAIGALSHLPGYYPPGEWDGPFAQTLAMGRPSGGDELLELLRRDFAGAGDWPQVMEVAQQQGWIGGGVAAVPRCQRKLKWIRGHPCVVLTTDFTRSDVSLDALKNVIDPLNWHNCLPFFCDMTEEPTRPDGWSRVLEHVSTTCSIPWTRMVTPLKYWKGQPDDDTQPQPTAWVDYELDDSPAPDEDGDGRMVVDEGFIRMTSTAGDAAQAGVRVRTRKVAGFRNLGWAAAAVFACAMGYGNEGLEMLVGGVAKRAKAGGTGWTDWQPSTPPPAGASDQPAEPGQLDDDADTTQRAVALAVDMLNECIGDMSKTSAALAAKWATGVVPIADTMTFTTDLATRLATDPWRYLERLRNLIGDDT